ncbi:MAG TPA: ATP-binding protein [Thermodesulfobacteriota bacterium]
MAAGLAHEMRNPLAAIEIHAGLLRRALDPALGAHAESLDHILAEVRRLNEAVATVLDFVRPVEIAERPVDVEALLEAATRQPCAGTVRIERDYAPGGTVALGDPGQLRQVFENLLRNAYEAVGASGTIHLRTRLVREGARVERPRSAYGHDALPAEEVAEPEVLVEIADDGPGIPPDVRDKVFQPFFTTKPRGSGLGLALVQKIVQSHRGRIDFTNGPGRGTVFRVVLPAVLGDAA